MRACSPGSLQHVPPMCSIWLALCNARLHQPVAAAQVLLHMAPPACWSPPAPSRRPLARPPRLMPWRRRHVCMQHSAAAGLHHALQGAPRAARPVARCWCKLHHPRGHLPAPSAPWPSLPGEQSAPHGRCHVAQPGSPHSAATGRVWKGSQSAHQRTRPACTPGRPSFGQHACVELSPVVSCGCQAVWQMRP